LLDTGECKDPKCRGNRITTDPNQPGGLILYKVHDKNSKRRGDVVKSQPQAWYNQATHDLFLEYRDKARPILHPGVEARHLFLTLDTQQPLADSPGRYTELRSINKSITGFDVG
jgi:hypothetical protein